MATRTEIQAYTTKEVSELLGIADNNTVKRSVLEGTFPFPAILIKGKYYYPKKPIDDWLKGKKPQSMEPAYDRNKGQKKKWTKENSLNWNYPMPRSLNDKFDKVCQRINETLSTPILKGDFIRVAIEEFIERRPEFLD